MEEYFVEEKSTVDRLFDVLVFFAVLVVTIFLILQLLGDSQAVNVTDMEGVYFYVNIVVFLIFFADLIRLWIEANNAKDFFRHNYLDVLATIPFGVIGSLLASDMLVGMGIANAAKWIRVAKLSGFAKVQRISRISKISKEFKAASHLKKEGEGYRKKHRL